MLLFIKLQCFKYQRLIINSPEKLLLQDIHVYTFKRFSVQLEKININQKFETTVSLCQI